MCFIVIVICVIVDDIVMAIDIWFLLLPWNWFVIVIVIDIDIDMFDIVVWYCVIVIANDIVIVVVSSTY